MEKHRMMDFKALPYLVELLRNLRRILSREKPALSL